jgi:hypothetical protein
MDQGQGTATIRTRRLLAIDPLLQAINVVERYRIALRVFAVRDDPAPIFCAKYQLVVANRAFGRFQRRFEIGS